MASRYDNGLLTALTFSESGAAQALLAVTGSARDRGKIDDDIELIAITARAEAPFGSRAMIGRDCPPAEPSISPARDVEQARP